MQVFIPIIGSIQIKKYKEAIDKYDKVVKEDKKYYSLAQNKKQECIKAMYDYLIFMTDSNKSLNGEAFNFHLGRCKVNDRIQFYLNRVFLPLIHYINDYLIEEMILYMKDKEN